MAMFVTVIAAILGYAFLTWVLVAVTLLVGHFFRDPERMLTLGSEYVIAPADGKIIAVEKVNSVRFLEGPRLKISIFMTIFDVHVNRAPISGIVRGLHYQKGRFLSANKGKASLENEQGWLWVQSESGVDVVLTQVAGLLARRIVCWPVVGDSVNRGERFGLIRFGSRLDVYLPLHSELSVSKGDRVHAGETPLCRLTS
jgi:phosphatidylserine decarboxylase